MKKLIVIFSVILINSICFANVSNINSAIKNGFNPHKIIIQSTVSSIIYGGKDISKSKIVAENELLWAGAGQPHLVL
jgi:hypothetical protein